MDIRNPVLAIVVGGSPAPGINGVITAVALEAMNSSVTVIGIKDGADPCAGSSVRAGCCCVPTVSARAARCRLQVHQDGCDPERHPPL
jgi:hypothetical protein